MSDDVFSEVRGMSSAPSDEDTSDSFSDVRNAAESAPPKTIPEASSTWGNAIKGVGQAGLSIGSGTLKGITSAANDILPGPENRKKLASEIETDPILNYRGGPEAQPILNALQKITAPIGAVTHAIHSGIAGVAGERTADVIGDAAILSPGLRGLTSKIEDPMAIEEGHPLSGAAQAEQARLGGFKTQGEQLGLDLPEGGTEARHAEAAMNNRPVVNAAVRQELQLPQNAPLSPQMMQAARNQYTSPAYQAVRDIKEIPLPKDYLGDIDDFDAIKEKYRPPVSGTLTGEQAVDLSRYLRNKANKYFASAKGNPEYEDIGQAHWDAAQAVEDAVKSHLEDTGQGKLAQNWDDARIYAAKTYSVENALDGAGNVKVGAGGLKQQLMKNKPLSGNLETLANLGAQYPEAFKATRLTMPKVGMIRRATAAALPTIGAAGGAYVGGGYGAAGGEFAGQKAAQKLLGQ